MLRYVPMVLRNAVRNRSRTILTLAVVMLGSGLLFSFMSVERSLDAVMEKTASSGHVVVQEQFRRWPTTSVLFDSMGKEIEEKVPHVVRAMPVMIAMSSWSSTIAKSFRLDGVDKDAFLEFWDMKVADDQLESFRSTRNGILVGKRVWEHYRWNPGDAVQLGTLNDVAAVVCGVYDAGGSALDSRALAGRRFMQDALGKQGIAHNILVKVDSVKNTPKVIRAIDQDMAFAKKTETLDESSLLADLVKELGDLRTTAGLISVVAIAAVFLGIWNTLSMTVRDRAQEFGVLRTIGFTRGKIVALVMMEGAFIAGAGGLLSIPVTFAATAAFKAIYGDISFMGVVVPIHVSVAAVLMSAPVAALLGMAGSIAPSWAASARPVVEALRSVD